MADEPRDEAKEKEIREENARIHKIRVLVDVTRALVGSVPDLTPAQAVHMIRLVRSEILRAFPGKETAYELIYAPRFERILRERFGEEAVKLLSGEVH